MKAVEQYLKYLNEPRKQYNGIIEKPARESTIIKMNNIEEKTNGSELATCLIANALENKKRILCWSDQHFGHDMLWKNGYRNFASREEMNNKMLLALQDVREDDILIFGGDLAFYNFKDVLSKIQEICCKKLYVIGNHDVRDNSLSNAIQKCFDVTTIAFDFDFKISDDETKKVIVSHYPISEDRLFDNQINLHGHTHQYLIGNRHLNMCVEHTGYKLKELNDFFIT